MSPILAYLLCLCVSSSLTLAWFSTNLPAHVFCLLRAVGWRRNDESFWPEPGDLEHWDREAWSLWSSCVLPPLLHDLLGCHICLSFHISFWTGLILGGLLLGWFSPTFAILCALSHPIAVHHLVK